ncbi:hypothetical protein [Sphingomonas sp. BK481]|uniref:hypothetical protein n=1 Tax=Sphingomonas sp. BK481 TaxID=2586981 RepID=UPI00179BA949|nr:hypothetical protein [Sphingomonas sp. BK481]MBB3588407.1 hypothetical protein [Sphingomonas sp. BK481]
MREIHAQRDLDPFDRVEEEEAKLLVEQVEINGVAKLGARLELLGADGQRRIIGIGNNLLEGLPIERETPVTNALKVENRLRLIGHNQAALHEDRQLIGETEMGFGVGRKHPAQI